jgi:hypothetical protein
MLNGFQKITFGDKPISKKPKKLNKFLKIGFFVFLGLLISFGLISIILYSSFNKIYKSAQITSDSAKLAFDALKKQDIDLSNENLTVLQNNISNLKKEYQSINYMARIPFFGSFVKDGEYILEASLASVESGLIAVETLIPYADLLGLKGKSTFVSGSADERIRTAVETLNKMIPKIDEIANKISLAENALEKVNEDKYPEKVGNIEVKSQIKLAKSLFRESASLFIDAKPLLVRIPDLLGLNDRRRYLVIFQNDAELRATGGFITAYALFNVDKGKIQVEKSDDIYKLDESKNKKFKAPDSILTYHKGVNYLELRDSNLSPDYMKSMEQFESMIKDSIPSFGNFDGIISLDTHVLVSAIKILGEFNIYGRKFSAELDKRCNCPKAIYELEDYSTRPVAFIREDRKDIIGALMFEIMQRAFGVSPSQYWGKLFQMFIDEARQKHVLFYFHDDSAQEGIEALGFGGRIRENIEGDYIHINDVNFAGAKTNMFIRQDVKQEYSKDGDGKIIKTVTITYKNPDPPSNCNLEAGQLCLNGILRNWLRIYVPKGSQLIQFSGSEKENKTYEEFDKTVFEGFMTVKPQGSAEVKLTYKLPDAIKGPNISLTVQKQPGTDKPTYSIFSNGKESIKTELLQDSQFSIKL